MPRYSQEEIIKNLTGNRLAEGRPKKKRQSANQDTNELGLANKQVPATPEKGEERTDSETPTDTQNKRRQPIDSVRTPGRPRLSPKENTKTISMVIPESLYFELKQKAANESLETPGRSVTVSTVIREAIDLYLH